MTGEFPRLDELDFAILDELQQDGRRSFREIGKRVGVAPATVRTRVSQLMGAGVVEIVAVPNPWKLGLGFFVTLALHIDPDKVNTVADILADREETSYVGIAVTGCEVLCEIVLTKPGDLAEYREHVLARLPGYRDVDVYFMSDTRKIRYGLHRRGNVPVPPSREQLIGQVGLDADVDSDDENDPDLT